MRQVLGPGALGRPRGIRWRGRWEGGSGWGIHVTPWLIHVNVWQNPLQCCEVVSLQLIKINGKKNKNQTNKQKNHWYGEKWENFLQVWPNPDQGATWGQRSLGKGPGAGWGVSSDFLSTGPKPPSEHSEHGPGKRQLDSLAHMNARTSYRAGLSCGRREGAACGLASQQSYRAGTRKEASWVTSASCVCWCLCSSPGSWHSDFKDNIRCWGNRGAGVLRNQTLQMN